MATRIRLKRIGAKKVPFYRIVVADSRAPRDGRFIEEIGFYDPLKEPVIIKVDKEKALDWLKKGAQPSETVRSLFKKSGVLETVTNRKWDTPVSKECPKS
ncbi:MAG: 30S ribosomal protein S16 [Desulfotomaculum sp.]|nr:30S ribosomal protein S16 [Desulfotomaculum sp.]